MQASVYVDPVIPQHGSSCSVQGELFKADGEIVGISTERKGQQAYGLSSTTAASGAVDAACKMGVKQHCL